MTPDLERQGARADEAWTPVVAFVAAYCAAIAVAFYVGPPETAAAAQWVGLVSVILATVGTSLAAERRIADPALFGRARTIGRGVAFGILIGTAAVVGGHFAALVSSGLTMRAGEGFPWSALALTIAPAVLHEELLFRGYAFQKLLAWSPGTAILVSAAAFAALHGANPHIGAFALVNIGLAGVLLALVFVLYRTLWAPIGAHVSWNVVSGPILGHELSGWRPPVTLFELGDPGPEWITGGEFGIEASVWMTLVQLLLIGWLAWRIRNGPGFSAVDTIRHRHERTPA